MTKKWTREDIEPIARRLCIEAGHNPDAVGEPPNDKGLPVFDHAFPRWMSWRRQAVEILDAADGETTQSSKEG